jgi:hypothetical protein
VQTATWKKLVVIMLNDISQSPRDKDRVVSLGMRVARGWGERRME